MSTSDPETPKRRPDGPGDPEPAAPPARGDAEPVDPAALAGSTMMHAGNAQADPAHPSWSDLTGKVEAFLRDRFGNRRLPSPFNVDDLVALAVQRLFRDLAQVELRDRERFWGWVRRLGENALNDFWRAEHADRRDAARREAGAGLSEIAAGSAGRSASMLARARELHDAMLDCLAQMRPETGDVLRLRLLEHKTYDEIAPIIGRNKEVTVRSIFLRGRQKLQDCLRLKGFADNTRA